MHHKINYIEMPSLDLEKTKAFYTQAFGWSFKDYGKEYTAIQQAGIDGGFFLTPKVASSRGDMPLVVLYSQDLEASLNSLELIDTKITQNIFSFPGGRRFHFADPSGNELAVWSDK